MVEPQTTPQTPAEEERTLRVRQAQQGNTEAFNQLVSESTGAVFGICWAYLQQVEVAEELTQEVFLRAWLKLPELRQPERFPAWIAQMARNEARNWNRTNTSRSKLVKLVPLEPETLSVADESQKSAFTTMQNKEEAALLKQALAKLTPEEREMIHLHYSESLSQRQIAERLEVNHSTVSRQLQRALGTLRSLLGHRGTPTALPTPVASPQLKSKITALVLASVATPGVLPKLRAEAALLPSSSASSSAPLSAATPLLTSIGTTISAVGTGITIMTLTQKFTAVAAIALLGFGGYTFLTAPAALPEPTRAVALTTGVESTLDLAPGETARLTFDTLTYPQNEFSKYVNDYERIDFTASSDGQSVTAQILMRDGRTETETLNAQNPAISGFHIWQEMNLFVVACASLEITPQGPRLTLFRANKPELLPQAKALEARMEQGQISIDQYKTQSTQLLDKNGLLPKNPAARAGLLKALWE
ncbi:MAG: sigma-70 family RNA polymerase sigma factor [Candidatus Sumerlaeia bacterium]|nr:sigma-70 family RNA polymerase sigma factor [Candidatus Sumerlaeia bacterium]